MVPGLVKRRVYVLTYQLTFNESRDGDTTVFATRCLRAMRAELVAPSELQVVLDRGLVALVEHSHQVMSTRSGARLLAEDLASELRRRVRVRPLVRRTDRLRDFGHALVTEVRIWRRYGEIKREGRA